MAVEQDRAGFGADVADIAADLQAVLAKAQQAIRVYNNREISTYVNGLTNPTDTVDDTSFDKETMLNTVFGIQQFVAFMSNQVVTQGDYIANFDKAAVLGPNI